MRLVVVDPGVLVAALISPAGSPARLVREWLAGAFELAVSPSLLAEVGRVLARPKLRARVPEHAADAFVALVAERAVRLEDPAPAAVPRTPDPGDDYLVALVLSAGASALVSGDAHLLGLDLPGVSIVTPAELLDEVAT